MFSTSLNFNELVPQKILHGINKFFIEYQKTTIIFLLLSYKNKNMIYAEDYKYNYTSCENYVMNTYLYLAFSICYIYLATETLRKYRDYEKYSFFAFVISILLLVYMSSLDAKENILLNHFAWILFLTCISIMLLRVRKQNASYALILTFCIFVTMSFIVYLYPSFFDSTFQFVYPALFTSLLMIICIELYFLLVAKEYPEKTFHIMSYLVIILFSLFIAYDTKSMLKAAEECRKYANYPKASVNFLLDLVNIFVRLQR